MKLATACIGLDTSGMGGRRRPIENSDRFFLFPLHSGAADGSTWIAAGGSGLESNCDWIWTAAEESGGQQPTD